MYYKSFNENINKQDIILLVEKVNNYILKDFKKLEKKYNYQAIKRIKRNFEFLQDYLNIIQILEMNHKEKLKDI